MRLLGALALVAAVTIGLAAVILTRPASQPPPVYDAAVVLRPLTFVPPVAYEVTSEDFGRFPLISRVFQAYENPGCCPEASIDPTGFLIFQAYASEVSPATSYLATRFEALGPNPARLDVIVVAYKGSFFSWSVPVS